MFNATRPNRSDLPTNAELFKSTGIAVAVAAALLITVVLPAEYGIDPTRFGAVTGLTEMGRIKRQLALEAEADAAADARPVAADATAPVAAAAPPSPSATVAQGARSDETTLTLAPDQGAEIKLVMRKGASARFTWSSSGGKVNFDTHADRPGVDYHAYGKGSSQTEEGVLTAAFDGSHGWYWRNRTGKPVTITLKTEGAYSQIKRMV